MGQRKGGPPRPVKGDIWRHTVWGHIASVLNTKNGVEFEWITKEHLRPFRGVDPQTLTLAEFMGEFVRERRSRIARKWRHWSKHEVATLLREWTDCQKRTLMAKLPGRPWGAIRKKAVALGLTMEMQGFVTVQEAANRCGICHETMVSVLKRQGVEIERTQRTEIKSDNPRMWVVLDDAIAAFQYDERLELSTDADRRLGLHIGQFRRWCPEVGAFTKHAPAMYDLIAKARGWFDGGVNLTRHSERARMSPEALKRLLRRYGANVPTRVCGEPVLLRTEMVDRVLALHKRRQKRKAAEARCGTRADGGEVQPRIAAATERVCDPPPPCSPVTRTKSPAMGRENR